MLAIAVLFLAVTSALADKPCLAREVEGQSPVCVCNETYCDEIDKPDVTAGNYAAYTSNKAGERFNKTSGSLSDYDEEGDYSTNLVLDTNTTYQTMLGFGGGVTDASSLHWKSLSEALRQTLVESYYGDSGLQYTFVRVPIGGTDFSDRAYAYNELPEDDAALSNYTLTTEDYEYKIPMIQQILSTSSSKVDVLATCWSPPPWMKTNDEITGSSRLKDEYFQTYADYHLKFLQLYDEAGVRVWGITTTNEPFNGVVPLVSFNSLGFSVSGMAQYIDENLGPTIRNSSFSDIKILAVDDQRYTVPIWWDWVIAKRPSVLEWIDGVAVHYYGDFITPASVLDGVSEHESNKFLLATEACEGSFPLQTAVKLGSWSRAENYIKSILEDVNHHVTGWIDWNLALNEQGGPNWVENYVDSPVIVYAEAQEFVKQPMYYAMGHFSKFVPRDSIRIKVELSGKSVETAAFVTPRDTVVVVVFNDGSKRSVRVQLNGKEVVIEAEKHSITTVEIKHLTKDQNTMPLGNRGQPQEFTGCVDGTTRTRVTTRYSSTRY